MTPDPESLEQPSQLINVPTTTTPSVVESQLAAPPPANPDAPKCGYCNQPATTSNGNCAGHMGNPPAGEWVTPDTHRKNERLIGEVTEREIHVLVCLSCGCVIGDTGLCDGNCKYDGDSPRLPETAECHVYKRRDEYVRKEPYHAD